MKLSYSFLKDELALLEIRKHKWLESEKLGREIGFATAACDWIHQYGEAWKQFRLNIQAPKNIFAERRRHRRFPLNFPLQLKTGQNHLASYTNDLNLVGLSCTIPVFIPENTEIQMTIQLNNKDIPQKPKAKFQFSSRVVRISHSKEKESNICYEVFLPFTEQVRDYLRNCAPLVEDGSLQATASIA